MGGWDVERDRERYE